MIHVIPHRYLLRFTLVTLAAFLTLVAASHVYGLPLQQSGSVTFSLQPSPASLAVGDTIAMSIMVDASTQQVDTAQAYLDFDPTSLQVVDSGGNTTSSVTPGSIFPNTWQDDNLENNVDNLNGHVAFAGGKGPGGSDANSLFQLAIIHFKMIQSSPCTNITFDTTSTPETKAVFKGTDVTGAVINGTVVSNAGNWNISQDCTITGDTQAPANVTVESPATLTINPGATLDINFSTNHLLIKDGAKVVIKAGGKIN